MDRSVKPVIATLAFLARHLLAVGLAIGLGWIAWTGLYALLLLVAMIRSSGVGGPLAYPAGLLVVAAGAMVIGWGIFTPSCAVGWIISRCFKLHRLAAFPIAFVVAGGMTWLMSSDGFLSSDTIPTRNPFLIYLKFLAIPFSLYWWLTEGVAFVFVKLWKRIIGIANPAC